MIHTYLGKIVGMANRPRKGKAMERRKPGGGKTSLWDAIPSTIAVPSTVLIPKNKLDDRWSGQERTLHLNALTALICLAMRLRFRSRILLISLFLCV
jgi:hypothetical protein